MAGLGAFLRRITRLPWQSFAEARRGAESPALFDGELCSSPFGGQGFSPRSADLISLSSAASSSIIPHLRNWHVLMAFLELLVGNCSVLRLLGRAGVG
jgi:hypothetical protein